MSESRYWQVVSDMAASAPDRSLNNDRAEELVSRVESAFEVGEHWAAETLSRWARDGARRDYNNVHKKVHCITVITRSGRKFRKTTSYSRKVRSPESGEVIGYQLQAFWGFDATQLIELRREFTAARDETDQRIATIDRLIEAMERHPECRTAREAWEADGRSVAEINLGEESA